MSLISLDHVSKIYPRGTRPALDDVSLHVDRGDFVFLVGASGSGKTTLLSLLLREEEANGGEIHVAGNDLRRLSNRQVPQYRRSLGFIFQDYKLLNNKTVYQNVAFALEVIGTSRATIRSLVPRVLETVGLTGKENNYPHELSGGEAQRVAIARAYVNHPQILLADEPTGNLDPTTSLGIMEVLEAINRTGTTIVMATHNEEIVNSMRKRVVELHEGKIVRDEREGSYDSALYFPDSDVEQKSKAQQSVGNIDDSDSHAIQDSAHQTHHTERHKKLSKKAQRAAQAQETVDIVTQSLQGNTSENEGIARLAQSVHSGRTGRYGEVFQSLETTMTWGRGLLSVSDKQDDDIEHETSESGTPDDKTPDDKTTNDKTINNDIASNIKQTATDSVDSANNSADNSQAQLEKSVMREESDNIEDTESAHNPESAHNAEDAVSADESQQEVDNHVPQQQEVLNKPSLPPMPPAPPQSALSSANNDNGNNGSDTNATNDKSNSNNSSDNNNASEAEGAK
ncbi:cell division ATP-binding protein FtsE [Gardnerella vaginalis JCP8481A]|nr:cell division ATP-binding protein FtsE [Gardnerella vaginalis]EPI42496.1 cell division ATP-binding protein FtsE [Gardnerella vaginalis JCP8481A]EPI42711.1 cell division ATP-binding protein FtsE [Gardnerella vaginalis JCP8481B]